MSELTQIYAWESGFPSGFFGGFISLFILLMAWSIVWKGLALWRAATRREKGWFIAFMVINTAGVLEILYLYVFGKAKEKNTTPEVK